MRSRRHRVPDDARDHERRDGEEPKQSASGSCNGETTACARRGRARSRPLSGASVRAIAWVRCASWPAELVRCGAAITVILAFGVLTAPPASAHTLSGPKPTNYRTRVVSVDPPMPGVVVRAVALGSIGVTNHTDTEVVVYGYENEPYLRVGPLGVFENLHSGRDVRQYVTEGWDRAHRRRRRP